MATLKQAQGSPDSVWVVGDSPADPVTSEFPCGQAAGFPHTSLASVLGKVVSLQPQEPHVSSTHSLGFLICKMCLVKGGYSLSAFELAEHIRLNVQMFDTHSACSVVELIWAGQGSLSPSVPEALQLSSKAHGGRFSGGCNMKI